MKKIYQTPQVIVMNIVVSRIVCGSLGDGRSGAPTVNLVEATESEGGVSADSRRGGFWDDEDY